MLLMQQNFIPINTHIASPTVKRNSLIHQSMVHKHKGDPTC